MTNISLDEAALAARALSTSPHWETLTRYLLNRFGFANRTTLVADSPAQTAFNEGQRVMLLHILNLPQQPTKAEMAETEKEK